ncbi:MAG TPA: hypothetical protein VJN96_20365 [Vicinamibacterales bacterium]|nr:hypothetical protein [Vicinamibacterales bacterium]
MHRTRLVPVLFACLVLAAVVRADVKTQQKSTFKFAGAAGAVLNKFGGAATKEGLVTTSAVKGNRKLSITGDTGEIIDLGEEKVYTLDMKGKSYKVATFAELRAAFEKAKADAAKQKQEVKPEDKEQIQDTGKQYEFDADVKETGQKKNIAGFDTHEVILTITAHEKGKKVEDSGGFIMTTDMWLAPKIAGLDELIQFQLKYMKAVYGEAFVADAQQMASTVATYPTFKPMAERMQAESGKLQGTPVLSSTTFDGVKSAEAMKQAQSQAQNQPPPTTGGGIGGALAKKMMGANKPPTQRGTVFTSSHEILSVAPTVTAEDVALPAGFKEKK